MLQHTFQALEKDFADDNDACIDSAKCMIEVVCRLIIDELDDPQAPQRPQQDLPKFKAWIGAAVRVLKLGDVRDTAFRDLISQHHAMSDHLGALRNAAGPVSHGRDGYIQRLSAYHRRAAVLSADAIVAFLYHAYLDCETKLAQTRLPYERFERLHPSIDRWATMKLEGNEFEGHTLSVSVGPDSFPVSVDASRLLFHFDRTAYVEALRAGKALDDTLGDGFEVITDGELIGTGNESQVQNAMAAPPRDDSGGSERAP